MRETGSLRIAVLERWQMAETVEAQLKEAAAAAAESEIKGERPPAPKPTASQKKGKSKKGAARDVEQSDEEDVDEEVDDGPSATGLYTLLMTEQLREALDRLFPRKPTDP